MDRQDTIWYKEPRIWFTLVLGIPLAILMGFVAKVDTENMVNAMKVCKEQNLTFIEISYGTYVKCQKLTLDKNGKVTKAEYPVFHVPTYLETKEGVNNG